MEKYVRFLWIFYLCYWLHFAFVNGQSNGDLRLSLGNEGILEIYYNGTWGYVCDDGWDEKDSRVACRNLGFGKVKTFQPNYYHPNRTNEEFKINDVNCTGNENSLLSCGFSFTVTYCYYYEHIYLDCSLDHCQSYLHNAEYSVQLVRYFNGVDWFYICKDNFSEKNAHVICYENYGTEALNYTFLSSSSLTANYSFYPYQFNCEGEEASLCNCPTANQTCESSEFVAVLCKKEVPSEGAIRLTSDDKRFLQAYINSEWIFVCPADYYYYYYSDDADLNYYLYHAMGIACRELGYSKVKSFQLDYDNYYYYQQNNFHLRFCPRNATKLSDCNHYDYYYCQYRISLRCEAETCATSLQFNSTSNSYQLAQTYTDNSWFYICPDSFTKSDADVICRNSKLPGSISFGHVSLKNLTQVYPISPNSYACTGNESSLCSCPSDTSTCNSSTAINVLCHEPNNGSIRLSHGYYGYVEVYNGEWKLVCDYSINSLEADIICRSAGFRRAESFSYLYLYYYYYYQADLSYIYNIHCFGNETSLNDCSYSEYSNCYEESIVTCEEDGCESLLRNPESLEAVQIYIGQWYSICEDNFTQQTADIICRENHDSNASNYTFLLIQPSSYPIYPFYFQCDGNENSVCACEMISQQCSSNRIVHVQCRGTNNGHLRLSNGTSGILEVYLDGWKRVCSNNYYGTSQAVSNVACRYLGYRDAVAFNSKYLNYYASTTNIFSNPRCFGNETNILECAYALASRCYYESYISCRTEGCQSYIFDENTTDQPVKMYMNENWYHLCSNSISTKEADVICRENGFLNGVDSMSSMHKSQLEISYEINSYNITCNGDESSLCDCSMVQMQCTEGNIAEIRCSQPDRGTLRYSNQYPNMLEIYYNGGWSHICYYNWDIPDSGVACRQLGYTRYSGYSATSTTQIATSYPNNFGNVSCGGTESSLVDCSYSNASCQSFNSYYTFYKVLLYCEGGDCEVFAPYATQGYQIVEYFINQQRHYLCADGFTAENADVVCRETANTLSINHRAVSELNLPPNTQIYPLQHSCLGNETSLCNCSTFQQSCSSGSSVEVQCGTPDQGTLRYSDLYSNVLEIFYNGGWSYICRDSWSNPDSTVACRQLGFTRSTGYGSFYYRTSVATSFLNNLQVSCNGNESSIIDCSYANDTCRYYSSSNYYYTYYLRLYCTGGDCEVYAPFATERFQIVEYFVNQQRYYLCAEGFTAENADVVCRETTGTLSITVRSASLSDLPLNTQIYPLQHFCFGNEASICNCTTSQESCLNGSVVEVQCGAPDQGTLRYSDLNSNVLEIYYNGGWSYICPFSWSNADSTVACRQLGFTRYTYYSTYYYSTSIATSFRNNLQVSCNGNESSIIDCSYADDTCRYYSSSSYYYTYYLTLYCTGGDCEVHAPFATERFQIVEYFVNQQRYYLCADGFTRENADVVCREISNTLSITFRSVSLSDLPLNTQIYPLQHFCFGNEASICNCTTSQQSCLNGSVVEVQCGAPDQGTLRYSDLNSNVLEIYYNGGWSYICPYSWSNADSTVACRQLGFTRYTGYSYYYYRTSIATSFRNNLQVNCNGNESSIIDCSHSNDTCYFYSSFSYYYTRYLSLYCAGGDCEVHAPFATERFQIVEYFVNQQRYYLCADGFTRENADVVCREASGTLSNTVRNVSLSDLPPNTQIYPLQHFCFGDEASICNCTTSQQSCPNGSVVEVQCGAPGTLRYSDLYSNVLEIYYNGGWSYICPYSWSNADSTVACRQLGFTRYTGYSYYYYRTSIATSFRNNLQVNCNGNESSIIDCSHSNDTCYSYSSSSYYYTRYLRLYCTGGDCEVHAPFATERFQIVEYFVNQQRYYLCADGFTRENADVVCREITSTLSNTVRSVSLSDLPPNTQIYPLQHFCFGNESSICNCTTSRQSCQNGSVVEVQCGVPEQGQIRLTTQNKLLFYYNQWRGVCSQRWDTGDSDVACRQLGYRNLVASTLIYDYNYYNYDFENFITDVTCFGNETQLSECRYHLARYCDSYYTISLTCQPDGCESFAPNAASYPQVVRYYSGGWYHLCGDGFTQENADVVCRENEGSTALSHSNVSNSDLTSGLQILERRFTCTGRETSLCDCSSSIESCPSNNVVQLQCNTPAYGHIRLANRDSGVLEIYLNQWGYVCDDGWNRIASEVVCKQLGLDRLISYEIGVEVNNLLYPFLLDDVECNGNESTIFECTHTLKHNCANGEHVSITCGFDQTPTTSTTSTSTTSTTSTSTMTTPTTSTTTVPTTSTTISTSTFITTTPFIGIAPKITSPGMNITKTLNEIDAAISSIECTATGDPTPDIHWSRDLTTNFIDSPILQINITDLSTGRVFYCIAENSAGRDVMSVTFEIVLTTEEIASALEDIMVDLDKADSISDDKSGQTADMTKVVIDASNDNVDIEGEEKNKILENAAMTAQTIVEKTNGTFSNETSEKITGLLSAIVNGSSGIQESESTVPQQGEESTVATVPSALAITLNTLERFSQRLSEELANSEVNSVKTVVSQLITIVVQNVELESSEDGETKTEIELPMKNSDDVEYSVMITLSTSLAVILSNNGKSLVIATSIVKRIEVKESNSGKATQGSDILTVALAGKSGIVELTENVKFTFDVYSNQPSESTCVFLNGTSWVSDGLSTDQKTTNLTNCESSHLTSFAVFVTPYKKPISYIESIVLSAISYLFVGISFIFLLISLILFLIAGKAFFKVEANIIYFNYCLSMLLATGIFIFGIQVGTYNIVLCNIIAFLLHYSWLSVFTWTLCIGVLIMYKIVINVLSTKKIYKYLIIFGWGFPLLIPLITIAVARDQYVDVSSHCFLNIAGGVIWAFIGPILAMILINAAFLIIALIRIIRVQASAQNNETRNIFKNALITGLVLTPVLGLPWLILIFNVTIQHSVLEWLFIIINGAMGFVFFLVVVLRNKEVLTRFKRNKRTTFSNTHQSSQQTAPSSTTPSSFTSNRFKKTNTIERHLVKESEIQDASIEQSEICKSPYETMDYQNNIYEVEELDAATPGKADENMTGYGNPFYTSDVLDDPPVYHNLSNKEIVTEVISNPMYMQSPSAGYTNELYSTVGDVVESDTQVYFNPDDTET